MALFVVAFTRIACPDGAANCTMGLATAPGTATAHLAGLMVFEVAFAGAVASTALCLWRAGARLPAVVAIVGIVLSIGLFALVPIDIGARQRLWLLVNSILIGGAHVVRHPTGQRASAPAPSRRLSTDGAQHAVSD
jgi:hypothetical protein